MRVMRMIAVAAVLGLNLPAGGCGGGDGDGGTGPGGGGGLSGDYTLEWVNEGGLPEDDKVASRSSWLTLKRFPQRLLQDPQGSCRLIHYTGGPRQSLVWRPRNYWSP